MDLKAWIVSHVDNPWHLLLINHYVKSDDLEWPTAKLKVILARYSLILHHGPHQLHKLAHSRVNVRFELLHVNFATFVQSVPQRGKGAFAIIVC